MDSGMIMGDYRNIVGFTKYKATLVVRCASDDKFYLYDIINIKKWDERPT